jgi:hypothetical protein
LIDNGSIDGKVHWMIWIKNDNPELTDERIKLYGVYKEEEWYDYGGYIFKMDVCGGEKEALIIKI